MCENFAINIMCLTNGYDNILNEKYRIKTKNGIKFNISLLYLKFIKNEKKSK